MLHALSKRLHNALWIPTVISRFGLQLVKAFFLKKQREDLVRAEAERKLTDYSQDCFERLSECSLKARLNTCLPGEVTPQKEEMILNAAFLIEALKHSVLMGAIYKLRADYEGKGFRFDCTGPWPPYNFCQFSKESMVHA